jgi:cell division GTPase FtsZ|tara:strand:+ start:1334 stop:2524 length:1191 start_codon:yes stop_codon:yes gene_type:complete
MANIFIGIGQCGGGILDSAFYDKNMFKIATPIAINSATMDLQTMKNIKRENWVGISKDLGFINSSIEGFESLIVGGYGKNRSKAESDALKHEDSLKRIISERAQIDESGSASNVAIAFVIFGLGGGTGSGVGPVVAKVLKGYKIPVIAIVVLPAAHEGGLTAKNAVESLNNIMEYVDSVILVDNEKLAYAESSESLYHRYNEYIARSIRDIVIGTALEKINPADFEGYAPVIDLKDTLTATSFRYKDKAHPGFAVLGRASEKVRGLLHYIIPLRGYKEIDVISLLYRAFMKLSVEDIRVEEAEKNLVLIRLPPAYLSKSGKINTSMAKRVMKERTRLSETHFGVALTKRNLATATVLLTYRPNQISRLRVLSKLANQYEDVSLKVLEEYEKDFVGN